MTYNTYIRHINAHFHIADRFSDNRSLCYYGALLKYPRRGPWSIGKPGGCLLTMFELYKHFQFEAGHKLPLHKGKCSRPHGHSYKLTVKLQSNTLHDSGSSQNMVMDFADLSAIVDEMIETYLDHHWLNDTLECEAPTAEVIARWIFQYLKPHIPQLSMVTLNETSTAGVSYYEPTV